MARASAGVSKALAVGAVFSVSVLWGASGPAQADIRGVVGAAAGAGNDTVGGVVGPKAGAVTDPVTHVTDPVAHVTDPVTHVTDPVTHVADPVTHVADPVTHTVTHTVTHAVPSPIASAVAHPVATVQKAAKPAANPPHAAPAPQRTAPLGGSTQRGPKARTASAAHAAGTTPVAEPSRHHAGSGRAARVRPSGAPDLLRASALGQALLLATVAPAGRQQVIEASDATAEQACRSASLTASDLLRCARVDVLLPNLGGPRTVLLPISLALIGVGLVMVVHDRRRHRPSVRNAS